MRTVKIGCLLLVGLFTLLVGCGSGSGGGNGNFSCPSASENVTWTSYGSFKFGTSGNDETARKIVSACGWHVYRGNNGGVGNTLQVANPSEAVVLSWAYNNLAGYQLTQGWTGKTDEGASIGISQTAFQSLYPSSTGPTGLLEIYAPGNVLLVTAYFDQNGLLTELQAGCCFAPPP